MSFGIQICDNAGKIIYDTNSVSWMLAFSTFISPGAGGSFNVPAIKGREVLCTIAFAGMPAPATGGLAPVVVADSASGVVTITNAGNLPVLLMVLTR